MVRKIGLYPDRRNKNKPWVVRWYGEYDPATGKQKRHTTSFRRKVEAEAFKAAKEQEFREGMSRDGVPDVTLSDFCRDWLKTRKPDLRPASYDLYFSTVQRLLEYFGRGFPIRRVTPKKAAVFVSEQKSKARGHEGRELSDSSHEQIKRQCKTIFGTAVEWGLLQTSPFAALRAKKVRTTRWHHVSPTEYMRLLEAAPDLRWKVFYALAYTSGARMGELFSLTWNDIDFERGRLIISNRERSNVLPPFQVKDHDARRIPLPDHTIDLLTEWQGQAPEGVPYILLDKRRYELVKTKWQQLRRAGQPWRNRYMINNVLRDFKSHYERAGIKPVGKLTIHTLRKCCGQNWADAGLPMSVVKELMGHSSVETTLEFYNQVDEDQEAKAARIVQGLIDRAQTEPDSEATDVRMTYEPISARREGA